MAVGDGFNDIWMLRKADVGVQIFSKDVPFMFGDILVSNLGVLNRTILGASKEGFESNLAIILLLFYSYLSLNL